MCLCWYERPNERPLFDRLENILRKLLPNDIAEHFVKLNEPYSKRNSTNYTDGKSDYLVMMSPLKNKFQLDEETSSIKETHLSDGDNPLVSNDNFKEVIELTV